MFYLKKKVDQSRFNVVRKVTNREALKIFLKTFDSCYQKDDPQNPYGELGDYLKAAKKIWHKYHKTKKIEYFLIFDGREPVAVSTFTNYNGTGYISNVGSLRKVRGRGYGKLATLYCVYQSMLNGNKRHCLATEEETYPNEFYKRIGFETIFTASGYSKSKKI